MVRVREWEQSKWNPLKKPIDFEPIKVDLLNNDAIDSMFQGFSHLPIFKGMQGGICPQCIIVPHY